MHALTNGQTSASAAANATAPHAVAGASAPINSPQEKAPEETLLHWRIHRLRQNPRLLSLVIAAYGIGLFFWLHLFPHPLTLLLPLGALTSSMAEYLFPVFYRLTTHGVYADCFLSRLYLPWTDVKRARYGADGVFLSPLLRPSRLDQFRGVRLCFTEGNDETVLETVRRCRRDFSATEVKPQ